MAILNFSDVLKKVGLDPQAGEADTAFADRQ